MPSSSYKSWDHAHAPRDGAVLRQALETIAGQAEVLAIEMEIGTIADRGGPDALRLLAAIVRLGGDDALQTAARN